MASTRSSSGNAALNVEGQINHWFAQYGRNLNQSSKLRKSALEIRSVLAEFLRNDQTFFWNIYAQVYDALAILKPYRSLQAEVFYHSSVRAGQEILDLGCGTGVFEACLLAKGLLHSCEVTAVDFSAHMLSRAANKFTQKTYPRGVGRAAGSQTGICPEKLRPPVFIRADISVPWRFLPRQKKFDLVVSANCLGFFKDPASIVRKAASRLKEGGRFVATLPAFGYNNALILKGHYPELVLPHGRLRKVSGYLDLYQQCFPFFGKKQFDFLVITLCNQVLVSNGQSGISFAPRESELRELFEKCGLEVLRLARTYAGQALIITAKKPEKGKR